MPGAPVWHFAWVCMFVNKGRSKKNNRLYQWLGKFNIKADSVATWIYGQIVITFVEAISVPKRQRGSVRDMEEWLPSLSALLYLGFRRQLNAKYDVMKKRSSLECRQQHEVIFPSPTLSILAIILIEALVVQKAETEFWEQNIQPGAWLLLACCPTLANSVKSVP